MFGALLEPPVAPLLAARIEELLREATLEMLEDEEDVREGLKALADEEGTVTWEKYLSRRAKRESAQKR